VTAVPEAAGFGAVVLAAGPSRRLGQPKQLLAWRGEPLVRRAARAAMDAGFWPVVVVLGARCDEVRAVLAGMPLATVTNPGFADGIAGSIRTGLHRLRVCAPEVKGAVFLACDQPLVEPAHLGALASAAEGSGKPIAASAYGGTLGVPALFAASIFPELLRLQGDAGARRVIAREAARVAAVPLAGGELDVDTPEDWQRLSGAEPAAGDERGAGAGEARPAEASSTPAVRFSKIR
jgi:molybdenum cofactor cytidylyltransferase